MRSMISLAAMMAAIAAPAFAAEDAITTSAPAQVDELTVTGTRGAPRSAMKSLVPIDVISRKSIDQVATAELDETLAALVPSFNVQTLPALDATIFVRPARLRNLSPDQTLVLLNGKRVHRSAMMMNPSYGSAFQAPDLDQIAGSALRSIEVLRDGAAAQYGSDAIAGVINLNLDDSAGFRAFAQSGAQFEGDGNGPKVGAHAGFRDDNAYFAVTGEYSKVEATSRAVQVFSATTSQQTYPSLSFPNPAVRWGKPEREATRLAMTGGFTVGTFQLYTFGTYGQGTGVGDFNYRGPAPTALGGSSVFNTSAVFPGFDLRRIYPTGFTPHFGSNDRDISWVGGAKTEFSSGLKLDVSMGYGQNRIRYFMTNSWNASLGPASPKTFDDGGVEQTEQTYNIDGSYPLKLAMLAKPLNIAFGAEHRSEQFQIMAGDSASYAIGPGAPALPCCSSGFPGYSPIQAGKHQTLSKAAYLDLAIPVNARWDIDAAVRYEDFSTFGNSTTYKVSSRFDLNDQFAVRGTVSTGFRAPTTAQLYSEGLSQFLPGPPPAVLVTTGRFSPVGPVAKVLNQRPGVAIKPLTPETSKNLSFGLVWDSHFGLQTTLDAYQIDIKNRLNTSTSYTLTAAENAALTALNVPNLQNIFSASFLQNDYNTSTKGIDLVSSYQRPVGPGQLTLTGAYSHIKTEITGGRPTLNAYSKKMTEDSLPKDRATFTAVYKLGQLGLTGRSRFYGEWSDWTDTFPNTASPANPLYPSFKPQVFSAITFVDLVASYQLTSNVGVTVGADNVFDKYPDKARWQTFRGLVYSRNSPYSTDGGYYYGRIDVRF